MQLNPEAKVEAWTKKTLTLKNDAGGREGLRHRHKHSVTKGGGRNSSP